MPGVLAVSDDPKVRETLVSMLSGPLWMLLPESVDSFRALAEINRLRPRIVVIQAELRHRNGLDLAAEILRSYDPSIIVVAQNEALAARAFDVGVTDYVVGTLRRDRLQKAVQRALARRPKPPEVQGFPESGTTAPQESNTGPGSKLRVKSKGGFIFLKHKELVWIEAAGNYLNLHCVDRTYRVREPLSEFYARLTGTNFVRIHRSIIVNTDHVRELRSWGMGDYIVVLANSKELPVSRSFRNALDRWMSSSEFNSTSDAAGENETGERPMLHSRDEEPPRGLLA